MTKQINQTLVAGSYKALLASSAQVTLSLGSAILDQAGIDILDQAGNPIQDQSGLPANGGTGIAYCGPTGIGSAWYPTQVSVYTSSTVNTPEAFLYLGPFMPVSAISNLLNTTQVTQIANSQNGSGDSIGLMNIVVPQGQALIVQWTGGDSAAVAVMTVTGLQSATYFQ